MSDKKNKGGRPRLPDHLQTRAHELARARHHRRAAVGHYQDNIKQRRSYHRRRAAAGPPLPFKPLTPQQKMSNLLDWHATCPGSQIFPPPDPGAEEEELYVERDGPPEDPPEPQAPLGHSDE